MNTNHTLTLLVKGISSCSLKLPERLNLPKPGESLLYRGLNKGILARSATSLASCTLHTHGT